MNSVQYVFFIQIMSVCYIEFLFRYLMWHKQTSVKIKQMCTLYLNTSLKMRICTAQICVLNILSHNAQPDKIKSGRSYKVQNYHSVSTYTHKTPNKETVCDGRMHRSCSNNQCKNQKIGFLHVTISANILTQKIIS